MARVASNPVGLHKFRPNFQPIRSPQILTSFFQPPHNQTRRFPTLSCQTNPDPIDPSTTSENPTVESTPVDNKTTTDSKLPQFPNRNINKRIAVVSTLAAVGLFLSGRLDFGVSLKDLSSAALPYEEALSNGKPTVVEFYADWCEICRELAPDVYKVEQQYK